jgi:carboxylesterase type B
MESGSANSAPAFYPSRNEPAWEEFVKNVPSCAAIATTGHTFSCLRNATAEEIAAGLVQSIPQVQLSFVWTPIIDTSRGSVYPDLPSRLYAKGHFSRIPFMAGTNRDEGSISFSVYQGELCSLY